MSFLWTMPDFSGGIFGRRHVGSAADLATYKTLHSASLAAPALRSGLNPDSASKALKHLKSLLDGVAVALTNEHSILAWEGKRESEILARQVAMEAMASGSTHASKLAVAAPIVVGESIIGSLVVVNDAVSATLMRATVEVAQWISSQLELAELDRSRTALVEAELRALRAQISPHFIYNALGAIASFVRTDPDRARELLLEFADFTRYSFRRHGEFTTLSEELKSVERYLVLERARFGDRLQVVTRIAPEVLSVTLPFLSVQPLVENAVRHGLEPKEGSGTITVIAEDAGTECVITVEDDGVGSDPESVRRALGGESPSGSIGLANVDERVRTVYGNQFGIVVETAPEKGTKVTVRIPKFAPDL